MSAGNTFENDLLKLILNGVAIANLADNAASAPLTNLYLSLHTADPGEAGAQNTTECAYGAYARQPVNRTGTGWTITANSASPASAVNFPAATSGTETAGWFAVGTLVSGAGKLLISGTIAPTIAIATGVTPQLTTATAITLD